MANAKNTSLAQTHKSWHVANLADMHVWIIDQDDDYIAELVLHDEDGKCKPEAVKAHARLIAAAPDLLDACHRLIEHLHLHATDAYSEAALEDGRLAITKANGK